MPPKIEFSREKIINAAFEIIREHGFDGVSARNIAVKLNCSTQPIYSLFDNMEEIKSKTYEKAAEFALSYMKNYKKEDNNPILNLVYGYMHFAKEEKWLYKSLYLHDHTTYDFHKEPFIGQKVSMNLLRQSVTPLKHVPDEQFRKLYLRYAIHLLGLGTLINTHTKTLSVEEAVGMLIDLVEDSLVSEGLTPLNNKTK